MSKKQLGYVLRSKEDILSWRGTFKKLISESEKKIRKPTLSVTLSLNLSLVLAILYHFAKRKHCFEPW